MGENLIRPIFAVSSWVCKYPDDIFIVAQTTEFKAIEWDLDYIPVPLSLKRRQQIKKNLKRLGISVRYHLPHSTCDIGSKSQKIRNISKKYLELNLELIAELDANYAILHFGQYMEKEISNLKSLRDLIETASTYGIALAIENIPIGPTSSLKMLNQIVFESGSELALDTGHLESTNILQEYLNLFSSKITHIHFYGFEDDFHNHKPFHSDKDALKTADLIFSKNNADWWTLEMDNLSDCIHLFNILKKKRDNQKDNCGL